MPQTCSQCRAEAPDDATFCSKCGAASSAEPASPPPPPPPPMEAPTTAPGQATGSAGSAGGADSVGAGSAGAGGGLTIPAFRFDAKRWTLADRIAGIATFVLFISLFLDWFTVSVGALSVGSASGLSAHGYLYLVLIICVVIVVYLALACRMGPTPDQPGRPSRDGDDGGDDRQPGTDLLRCRLQTERGKFRDCRLEFRRLSGLDRRPRRGRPLQHPGTAQQDDVIASSSPEGPLPTRGRRGKRRCRTRDDDLAQEADGTVPVSVRHARRRRAAPGPGRRTGRPRTPRSAA